MKKGQLCTNCGKPDDFSDETICHECIKKWQNVLIVKAFKQIDFNEVAFCIHKLTRTSDLAEDLSAWTGISNIPDGNWGKIVRDAFQEEVQRIIDLTENPELLKGKQSTPGGKGR